MDPRDEDDERSLDELEDEIRRDLNRLEFELGSALGRRTDDPEQTLESFERLTARLETTFHDLAKSLARLRQTAPTDLNRLASKTLLDVLADIEKPLVLRVTWAEDLPYPTASREPLQSLIARILTLVGRFAWSGDVVCLETLLDEDDVVLRIRLEPSTPLATHDASREFDLRESSLRDFVADLGGRFVLTRSTSGGVQMDVRLPVSAQRS